MPKPIKCNYTLQDNRAYIKKKCLNEELNNRGPGNEVGS